MKIRRPADPELRVTVNNSRCHRYGICQAEADGANAHDDPGHDREQTVRRDR